MSKGTREVIKKGNEKLKEAQKSSQEAKKAAIEAQKLFDLAGVRKASGCASKVAKHADDASQAADAGSKEIDSQLEH